MKIRFLLISLMITLVFGLTNCKKEMDCCVIIDVDVQLHYQTQAGDNLINSANEFDESNLKIYYKNADEFEYAYDANLTHPNMHRLHEDENEHLILTVFPSNHYVDNWSTTLIELNENLTDTLVCEFEFKSNSTICKRTWLNGVEYSNRFIEIKK